MMCCEVHQLPAVVGGQVVNGKDGPGFHVDGRLCSLNDVDQLLLRSDRGVAEGVGAGNLGQNPLHPSVQAAAEPGSEHGMVSHGRLDSSRNILKGKELLEPKQQALVEAVAPVERGSPPQVTAHGCLKIQVLHGGQIKAVGRLLVPLVCQAAARCRDGGQF